MTKRIFPIFTAANSVEIRTENLNDVAPDQIRVEAIKSGISAGTEGMWFDGSAAAIRSGRKTYPYTPGYEFVGRITEIGANVKANPDDFPRFGKLKEGDRIFAFKPHASVNDIAERELWVALEPHVSDENALAHALSCTCLHAIHRASPSFGSNAAVFGLGTLGFIMIQLLASMRASNIVAVTTSENKKQMALSMGATATVSLDDLKSGSQALSDLGIVLADTVYECSGSTAVLEQTTLMAANQGEVIATGFYNDPVVLDGEHLFAKELTVKGVRAAGAAAPKTEYLRWPRDENLKMASGLVASGDVSIEGLVTHQIKPEELQKTYEMIRDRSEPYLQILINWQG